MEERRNEKRSAGSPASGHMASERERLRAAAAVTAAATEWRQRLLGGCCSDCDAGSSRLRLLDSLRHQVKGERYAGSR